MFTKYSLFVLCGLILIMKFEKIVTSNSDTDLPTEHSESEKSVANNTTPYLKPSFMEKEIISSEGPILKKTKKATSGLTTSNILNNTTRTVASRENTSKKVETSKKAETNKPEEPQDDNSKKTTENKKVVTNKPEEPQDDNSKKTTENKKVETNKPEEPQNDKLKKATENKAVDDSKLDEPHDGKSKKLVNSNVDKKKTEEPQEEKPKETTKEPKAVDDSKLDEPHDGKSKKLDNSNVDKKKTEESQVEKPKETTKESKVDDDKKLKQTQENSYNRIVELRTSTTTKSGNDKSDAAKIPVDTKMQEQKKDIHTSSEEKSNNFNKKPNEISKINMNQSDVNESSNSHFMVIIFIGLLFTITAYVLFQKRKKIIAYVIEGRRRNSRDRRTSGSKDPKVSYKPLDTEDKEAGINNYKYVY